MSGAEVLNGDALQASRENGNEGKRNESDEMLRSKVRAGCSYGMSLEIVA
jgi:hypothetical protein